METCNFHVIFFNEFKLGHSAAQATRNINMAFGKGSVNSDEQLPVGLRCILAGDTSFDNKPVRRLPFPIARLSMNES